MIGNLNSFNVNIFLKYLKKVHSFVFGSNGIKTREITSKQQVPASFVFEVECIVRLTKFGKAYERMHNSVVNHIK
jgi:hypothetical protein